MSIGSAAASQALLAWLIGESATPPAQLYAALGTGVTNGALVELTTTDYARQPVSLVAAAGVVSNAAAVTFGPSSAGWSIGGVALFDALTGGTCWFVGPTAATVSVSAGQQASFATAALTFTFLAVPSIALPPISIVGAVAGPPQAGTAYEITAGGTAVTAITGPVSGGYITNPATPADQGLAATETLYVDPANVPGSTDGAGSNTTSALQPGQTWSLPAPLPAGAVVRVNAASAGHKFVVVVTP